MTDDESDPGEAHTDGDDEEIPLNIAGHDDRAPPEDHAAADAGTEDSEGEEAGDEDATDHGSDGEITSTVELGTPAVEAGPVDTSDLLVDQDGEGTASDDGGETAADDGGDTATDDDGDTAAEDDGEVEPIELLVQLAKDGEIDPWDIDVVAVTEEFLDALEEGSLRESGRALFYASVLVRMKSDVLLDPDAGADQADDPWDAPMEAPADAGPGFDPVDSLEQEMERRLQRKHVRGTPETLDELVRELREAERGSWWKQHREYDTTGSPAGFDRGTQTVDYHMDDERRLDGEPTAREVTERTHGEDIEEIIATVRTELREHYDGGRPEVLFREVEDAGGSRVLTFLAVLFLANRGEVRLQQDQLFGDLWIQDPTADLGAEGAVAD